MKRRRVPEILLYSSIEFYLWDF